MCRGNTIHTCRVGSGYSFHGASWVTGLEFWFRLRLEVFCRKANFGCWFWPILTKFLATRAISECQAGSDRATQKPWPTGKILIGLWPNSALHTHNSLSLLKSREYKVAQSGSQKVHFLFAGLTSTSRTEDYYTDNGKAPRHCGKTAPKDFGETVTSNAAALRLVFHSNQDDSCKGFAFQYRVETSKYFFYLVLGWPVRFSWC